MRFKFLIDGVLTQGASTMGVENPATGKVFETGPRADKAQLDLAVAAAKRAFPAWAATSLEARAECLTALAGKLEANAAEMAALLTREQGKPLVQSQTEVGMSVAFLHYTATLDMSTKTRAESEAELVLEQRTPLGVVAVITPWNVPLGLLILRLAPALLAGNTVVAKPAPTTPLTTLLLGELAADIFPPGVFNTLADANDLGAMLSAHADIAKVAFTGSTQTGKHVMKTAADTLKRISLELGGNDAAIVLDDVDVAEVAPKLFTAAMANSGQICLAAKRVYAARAIYDELCAALGRLADEAVVGDGAAAGTQFGPIQNKAQFDRVTDLLREARSEGKVVGGGKAVDGPGYFIAPTIVQGLDDDARLVREEQFGPILPILPFDDEDDMLERVNNSAFGLAGSVWAKDETRALDVAKRINAGTVWINCHMQLRFDVPVGGAKQSGMGVQLGREGLEEFTQLKIITLAR